MKETWSPSERRKRYKDCSNPKGFTMKQFCRNQKTRSRPGEKANESIRRLVREMLLIESYPPPNFAQSTTHSVGWIDPGGMYHYDPNKRYHNVFDNKKSLVEGDWETIEKFTKRLP